MSKQSPKTQISQLVTVAVQKLQGKVNFQAVNLKKGAIVPELRLKNENGSGESKYPLIGDRYLLGRSSSSCDITIRNNVVSQIHCSLQRDPKNPHNFLLTDENSTNGVYMGKRRLKSVSLRHGDTFTLAPPDLANCVTISYYCPPPLWARLLRYGFYGAGGIFGLLVLGIIWESRKVNVYPLPSGVSGPVVVYPRDGQTPLNPRRQETHQELDNLGDFSPYLPKAVVASEDSRFYWHFGVDPLGIVRAVIINRERQGIHQGASTLTQQLARSLFPEVGRQNTADRKIREMVVALQLEAVYSKDTILKTYLNRVYLGLAGYGFEDAARFYFDKSARDLDISEAATLVAMLPAPNRFNPIQDYDTSVQLRNRVIDRMAQLGMISPEAAASARRSRIEISPQAKKSLSSTIAPYFYSYVFEELQDLLGEEVAKEGNFIVETSLDRRLQAIAEKSLKTHILNQGPRYRYSQGALVTLNSQTGEILALVGGVDYQKSQFNRAIQAKRQPGSTFKVFAYTAALEKGISPYKTYTCAGLSWQGQAYSPCERSSGAINMFQGLAQSENSVALRIAREAGLSNVVNVAELLGVKSPLNPVPGLILGQSEVNVLEMTGAYAVFDHGGRWNRPHAIKRILDASDCKNVEDLSTCRVIYDYGKDSERNQQVISPKTAETMNSLLRGVITNGTGGAASIGMGEAGKTGTTNNYVDLWFIGYLPRRDWVTGIWLGNDNNSPTSGSSQQAARLWGDYHRQLITTQN
ncbi:MrcB protein [Microcystis aeruginosa PCC 9807]|uniref:MrcB protein n=1 Tax=Microcystis aeruginosa PCC 9807 TaxID=1160283 RepID=I4H9H7_MICAE|nr:PBP1A family penicillin-binding protein [Microcystis aeruginosa]CCI18701.1 MrcB protein [Microcystis aeruginosa PCC 9807]